MDAVATQLTGSVTPHRISSVAPQHTSSNRIHEVQESNDIDFDVMYGALLFEEINNVYLSDDCEDEGKVEENEETSPELEQDASENPAEFEEILDINDILQQLAVNIDRLSISKFNICRSDVWGGVLRGMTRKSFSPGKKVSVKFTDDIGRSEGAVDLGGPMREFFTLAVEKVTSGKLFCGKEQEKFLSLDAKALKQEEYFFVGQLFSMSLVHCGIGPRCLSPILFDSLVKGPSEVVVPIESVYDPELQVGLLQLMSAGSVEEANKVIADKKLDGVLELAGSLRWLKTVDDVRDIASETAHWFILGRTRPAFESFRNGLNCLGLLDSMLCNPKSFHQAMCFHEQLLSADVLEKLFTVCRSEKESNRWRVESQLLAFWRDLLLDIEEGEHDLSLSDVLFFASGLKFVPCRTIEMELAFLHDPEANGQLSKFPKANTCSCVIYLPVTHSVYSDFKAAFKFALLNAKGFGHA